MADNEISASATPKDVKAVLGPKLSNPDAPLFVFKGWCKKCGICIGFCPHKALEWDKDGYPAVNSEKCKLCHMCEYRCPDFAITILQGRK